MDTLNNYVVMYSPFKNDLFSDYDVVQGKTYIDAARKYVKDKFNTVKRSGERDVNLSLLHGEYDKENNTIKYKGKQQWYKCVFVNIKLQQI